MAMTEYIEELKGTHLRPRHVWQRVEGETPIVGWTVRINVYGKHKQKPSVV